MATKKGGKKVGGGSKGKPAKKVGGGSKATVGGGSKARKPAAKKR